MKKGGFFFLFLVTVISSAQAQKVAIKSNLLYDATTTINLGVEVGLSKKFTLDLSGNYNPWKLSSDAKLKHWLVQPELRYWLCERFNGHFFGLHAHYSDFNVGGIDFIKKLEHNRFQGELYGAGIGYGYQWLLSNRWSIEAEIGVGWARINYDKFPCETCGKKLLSDKEDYFGVTKAALSIIYFIK